MSRRHMLAGASAFGITLMAGPAFAKVLRPPTTMTLHTPEGRAVQVTEWRPAGKVRGTILFSHGAASSPRFYDLIINPWVAAGWHVLAPLHVDSKEHPDTAKFAGLASWKARIEDMRVLIAHIGSKPFVAAGHSYGGLVATVLGGVAAVPPEGLALPLVPRLAKAVIAFSPPPPVPVLVTEKGYGALAVPALIQTGTLDIIPGMSTNTPDGWKAHLAPFYAAAPGGDRYGLVLDGANHYFGGAICDPSQPGPQQRDALEHANTCAGLFLEGYGAANGAARRHLDARVTDALPVRLMKR